MIVAWQGLGYNRRAVSLHRAARIVAEHGWPDDLTELPGVGPYTAAAVGNFAFGRDVLPIDTNVRRIQERTGETFDGSCAQALFDLGATICLARIPRCGECPLAAGAHRAARATNRCASSRAFEGSFRERRAQALRAVARGEQPRDGEALVALERDGLVVAARRAVASLPATEATRRGERPRRRDLARERRLVGDEAVDAERDQLRHAAHVVDRPRHDAQPEPRAPRRRARA